MMIRRAARWSWLTLVPALVLAAGCARESDAERFMAQGEERIAQGNYDEAEDAFLSVLAAEPENARAIGRLGVLYYEQGRVVPAHAFLEQALKQLPDDPEFRLTFGLTSFSLGRTADARLAARRVLELQPSNDVALLLLAETCVTTRDNEEVRRIISELMSSQAETAGHHVALSVLLRGQRDLDGAESALQRALVLAPESSAALNQLSNLAAARGDTQAMAEALRRAAEAAPLRSPLRIKYIRHLLQRGARDEARRQITTIVQGAPDRIPALVADMQLAAEDGRREESSTIARKILQRDPTNYEALMQLGANKVAAGDFDGAIGDLKRAEEHYGRAPRIKYELALVHLRKGDTFQAEENLKRALALAPSYEEALLLLAELHVRRGDPLAAVTLLEPALQRPPTPRRAVVLLAQAYRERGDSARALALLRALVESAPANPDNHFLLGLALVATDPAGAREAFEAAVQRAAHHWRAQQMLIDQDVRAGRMEEAGARVEALVARYVDDAAPRLLRARLRRAAGDTEGAAADLRRALELDPMSQEAYVQLARIYFEHEDAGQAVATLQGSAESTQSPALYTQLGMLYAALDQHEPARAAYERALALDANFVPALNNLAVLLGTRFSDPEQGLKLARRAYDRLPGDARVGDTLGWMLVLGGQYTTALPYLQAAAEQMPAEPAILHHLAMAHYFLEQEDVARQWFERIAATGTDSAERQEASAVLEVLAIRPEQAGAAERERLQQRLAAAPRDLGALARLGLIEARAGDPARAADLLEAAVKINPRSVRCLLPLVDLYVGPLSNHGRARELASQARVAAPTDGLIAWRLGTLALRSGDYSWATSLLEDAARTLPPQPSLQFDLARALYGSGRVQEAETRLRELLQGATAELPPAARQMGDLLAALRDPDRLAQAQPVAEQVLAEDPQNLPALMVRAATLLQAEQVAEARALYDRMLERQPAFSPALRQLALLFARHFGDDGRAEELANKARQAFPDDPDLSLVLGEVHFRRGDYEGASRFLQQALRQRPEHAQTAFLLGNCLFYLKNEPESRSNLRLALRLGLPPQEAGEAERVLQQLDGATVAF